MNVYTKNQEGIFPNEEKFSALVSKRERERERLDREGGVSVFKIKLIGQDHVSNTLPVKQMSQNLSSHVTCNQVTVVISTSPRGPTLS